MNKPDPKYFVMLMKFNGPDDNGIELELRSSVLKMEGIEAVGRKVRGYDTYIKCSDWSKRQKYLMMHRQYKDT